jgi:VanZ family protein
MKIDFIEVIQRFRLLIGGLYSMTTLLILFGTLMPGSNLPEYQVFNYDKLVHAGAFMAWTLATGITWRAFQPKRVSLNVLIVTPLLFGIAIEILQGLLPTNRSPEWMDIVFDAIGTFLGVLLYLLLLRIKDQSERTKSAY